jgi:uncharacterized protein with PIN domain
MILDTHVWIWWLGQNGKLPQPMRKRIEAASSVAVSAASVYEVALAVATAAGARRPAGPHHHCNGLGQERTLAEP